MPMRARNEVMSVSKRQTISFTENANGLLLKRKKNGRMLEKRQILLLSSESTSGYNKIGTALGQDLLHCIYLADRHGKDFVKRVRAYYINNCPRDKRFRMEITFYEKKNDGKKNRQ